ncbi:MAG TPA: plastocyanin/azurin family copper-binding protein [Mycobacteriales bacterium]|nr:plastocyanin/azurin family copper-binding protein [Mycobacteriales bacterium]
MTRIHTRTAGAAAALAVALVGLASAAAPADAVTRKKVTMTNSSTFLPARITVPRGTIVTWANTSFTSHTVTAASRRWSSGRVLPGDTFSRTFRQAGTYRYLCTLHPGMTGTVNVT